MELPEFRQWILQPDAADDQYWQEYLQTYPDQFETLQEARYLLNSVTDYFESHTSDAVRESGVQQIVQTMALEKAGRKRLRKAWMYRAAAATVLLALGMTWWYRQQGFSDKMLTFSTSYGEWKTVDLPDGSVVELNANSTLEIAADWEEGADRKVWLKGEAFFKVMKKPATQAKFLVITRDLTVEVLGTSFNVFSREEGETQVFLEEGKIKLDLGQEETYMEPGELLTYSPKDKALRKQQQQSAQNHTSWKDGALILEKTPTAEIFDKIEDIYGVTFEVRDSSLLREVKTVKVPMDKLDITLPILERILGVDIVENGKTFIVR